MFKKTVVSILAVLVASCGSLALAMADEDLELLPEPLPDEPEPELLPMPAVESSEPVSSGERSFSIWDPYIRE